MDRTDYFCVRMRNGRWIDRITPKNFRYKWWKFLNIRENNTNLSCILIEHHSEEHIPNEIMKAVVDKIDRLFTKKYIVGIWGSCVETFSGDECYLKDASICIYDISTTDRFLLENSLDDLISLYDFSNDEFHLYRFKYDAFDYISAFPAKYAFEAHNFITFLSSSTDKRRLS